MEALEEYKGKVRLNFRFSSEMALTLRTAFPLLLSTTPYDKSTPIEVMLSEYPSNPVPLRLKISQRCHWSMFRACKPNAPRPRRPHCEDRYTAGFSASLSMKSHATPSKPSALSHDSHNRLHKPRRSDESISFDSGSLLSSRPRELKCCSTRTFTSCWISRTRRPC